MNKKKKEIAVGLKYNAEKDNAPRVKVKGRGEIAKRIIEIAKTNNVPIYKDEVLVEILNNIEIDYEIPEFLFKIVAEIYAYTYTLLKNFNQENQAI